MENRHRRILLNACLSLEGKTVNALASSRVSLVCADFYLVKRAVVFGAAVMLAVVDCTADVLVCKFSSHNKKLPFVDDTAFAVKRLL